MSRPTIHTAPPAAISDEAITSLLVRAYVGGGHTTAQQVAVAFHAAAVRARGTLWVAQDPAQQLLGVVIDVPADSPACRFARPGASEIHLLATDPRHRGQGIGRALVEAVLASARARHTQRVLLWTQPAMLAAQRLYRSVGFERVPERDFCASGRDFWFFEIAP